MTHLDVRTGGYWLEIHLHRHLVYLSEVLCVWVHQRGLTGNRPRLVVVDYNPFHTTFLAISPPLLPESGDTDFINWKYLTFFSWYVCVKITMRNPTWHVHSTRLRTNRSTIEPETTTTLRSLHYPIYTFLIRPGTSGTIVDRRHRSLLLDHLPELILSLYSERHPFYYGERGYCRVLDTYVMECSVFLETPTRIHFPRTPTTLIGLTTSIRVTLNVPRNSLPPSSQFPSLTLHCCFRLQPDDTRYSVPCTRRKSSTFQFFV